MRGKTTIILALLGLGLGACQVTPVPLRPTATSYRGLKARVFPNVPDEVFAATRAALVEKGFVIREDGADRKFIHAHTIAADVGGDATGQTTWTRVTARVDFVDRHKRAPRTLLEVEGGLLRGSADGPFEAGVGDLGTEFYDTLFKDVEYRLPRPRMPQLGIPGLD